MPVTVRVEISCGLILVSSYVQHFSRTSTEWHLLSISRQIPFPETNILFYRMARQSHCWRCLYHFFGSLQNFASPGKQDHIILSVETHVQPPQVSKFHIRGSLFHKEMPPSLKRNAQEHLLFLSQSASVFACIVSSFRFEETFC